MTILEKKYSVNVFDTDHNGRLSAGALFNYFQDIAGRHASDLGFGREHLITNGFFWVLSRMVVEIERMPTTWEEVTVKTWPRGTDTIFALRDIEMRDADGNRLAAASSSWVIVDYNTHKVQRPDRALSHLNTAFPENKALRSNAGKIPVLPSENHSFVEYLVTPEDIDVNMHVNNARYIHWACNSYDIKFLSEHIPSTIEVNYLSEGHAGDRIIIETAPETNNQDTFFHSVVKKDDSDELCRLRIRWREEKV